MESLQHLPCEDVNRMKKAHEFEKSFRARPSVTEDSFYTVQPETAGCGPGSLLKVEENTDTSLYTLPPNVSMSRFVYQSTTSDGSLVPVSAYVLWPYVARQFHNGLPIVAWAHGTSGVFKECAPSNNKFLWHQFQMPFQLVLNGYVIIATDYAGLGLGMDANGKPIVHEYLNGPAHANDIYYSIMAARQAFPKMSEEFVAVGTSQGGTAAWAFAQKLALEPMPGHLGTVVLHPVTRLLDLPLETPIMPLLLIMLAPSLIAKYPGFQLPDIFTAQGVEYVSTMQRQKGSNALLFALPLDPQILKSGWRENKVIQAHSQHSAAGRQSFSGPLLIIQGAGDPIISADITTAAVHETAVMFPSASIEYHLLPGVSHDAAMYGSQYLLMDWIAARFSGQPTKEGLLQHTAQPTRPEFSQKRDANWFIQHKTEAWQSF